MAYTIGFKNSSSFPLQANKAVAARAEVAQSPLYMSEVTEMCMLQASKQSKTYLCTILIVVVLFRTAS